jgi:hypothetical protein
MQTVHQGVSLDDTVENGVGFHEIRSHGARRRFVDNGFDRRRDGLLLGRQINQMSTDGIKVPQNRIDLAAVGFFR